MPFYFEFLLWLIFGSLTIALVGFAVLIAWRIVRIARRAARSIRGRREVVYPIAIPIAGAWSVSDLAGAGLVWVSLFALIPLLLLAVWAATNEIAARAPGFGLLFAFVHLFLLWQLTRLGTQVQRRVELSRAHLVVHPAVGRRREIMWLAVVRVEDVSYVGPGVSGLFLYETLGPPVVVDSWLPSYAAIRHAVRRLVPNAQWSERTRGFLFG